MKAKLISYDLSKLDQIKKVIVKRQLFGYTEYSNNSKYTYKRKGVLEEIPHIKVARAVIIVQNKDKNKVIKVVKGVKGKYTSFDIEIKGSLLH